MLDVAAAAPDSLKSSPAQAVPRRGRALARWGLAARLLWFAVLGCFAYHLCYTYAASNFRVVLPQQFYRSAQLAPEELSACVKRYGIRTVVNLRGCIRADWYEDQSRRLQELGVGQEDLFFSANRMPSAREIRRLVEVLDNAEKPMLIHCRQGADRTGLASVLARLLYSDDTLARAKRHLGFRFGHLRVGNTAYMDVFFELYEAWLKKENKTHEPALIRHWAMHEYRGGWCQQAMEEVTPLSELRTGQLLTFRVVVRNVSDHTWHFRPYETAGLHLCVMLFNADNKLVVFRRAGVMKKDVGPGEAVTLTAVIPPLLQAGRYRLRLDMLEEGHGFFQQAGADPWEQEIVIE